MPSVFFISLMSASPWGGSEELWYRTALYAAKQGWKVGCAVYHWKEKEKRMQPLKDAGAAIYYLPNKGRTKRNIIERIQNKVSKWKVKSVADSLPVNDYDLVVINLGAFEITTAQWKFFYKKPDRYIVLYHNYKEHEVLKGSKKKAVQNWISHAAQNLFASRRIIEVLRDNSGIDVRNSAILFNPISFVPPHQPLPYPLSDKENCRLIMLAALDVSRKAQDHLIRSLSSQKWKQRKWTLHLYGEGKDREKLAALIRGNNMEQKIFLEGYAHDVRPVLEKAHLLLQLTHTDAMPLSVVEAMAVGRPVAVSKIGDMPYWIAEGENGWVSEDASEKQIDLTLERAWQQKHRWEELGRNAFKKFKEKFPSSAEGELLKKIDLAKKK